MLCVPQQTVEAAHSDICGSLFEKVTQFSFMFLCYMRSLVMEQVFVCTAFVGFYLIALTD